VLHHSIAAAYLAKTFYEDQELIKPFYEETMLAALLHDAHEAITGDVPKDWKPEIMAYMQDDLDARIYKKFGIPYPSPLTVARVKHVDKALLAAEARIMTSKRAQVIQQTRSWFKWPNDFSGKDIGPLAEEAVIRVRDAYPEPRDTLILENKIGIGVTAFMRITRKLTSGYRKALNEAESSHN
jgi:hypothetical protein